MTGGSWLFAVRSRAGLCCCFVLLLLWMWLLLILFFAPHVICGGIINFSVLCPMEHANTTFLPSSLSTACCLCALCGERLLVAHRRTRWSVLALLASAATIFVTLWVQRRTLNRGQKAGPLYVSAPWPTPGSCCLHLFVPH